VNALVVCNPQAGRQNGDSELSAALDVLRAAGWTFDMVSTTGRGEATRLAREAADAGLDALVVAGGDGTINEVIQGLSGSETALGHLPYGTINIWAREMGIPLRASLAAVALTRGQKRRVDLGVANGRRFLLMASVGFDGVVLQRAERWEQHKRQFGILPYLASGFLTAPGYRGADYELRYDGLIRKVQALMIVVGNTRVYGGRYRLTPEAVLNDGRLDVCIVKGRGLLSLVRQSLPVLLSGSVRYSDVEMLRVKDLSIRSDKQTLLQVDGELIGKSPVTFGVAPGSLQVLAPCDVDSGLMA
jgi:YegS/Rv2252/BmrU family lipid kinase